ncbi:COG1179 Dinucleotide-utilizing enzymes involved in molybdopterin and thiamine biosynthesis family 1 [Burkholderiaceae bacterium]
MQKDLVTEQLSHTSDAERRFGGLERLYGSQSGAALQHAHVAVVGIGGVGSWAAEALARSGVGALTLIDLDHVAESNINRQVHALTETLGQSKIAAMAQRIHSIHPDCRLTLVDDFLTPDNVQQILPAELSVVLDCTDQVAAKIAMVLQSRARQQALIVCGGAGGKTNSLALQVGDLAQATHDALLARVRNTLRRDHRFARASNAAGKALKRVPKMGVRVLWVDQPTRLPEVWQQQLEGEALQGLSCAGYGSTVTVTAAMGFAAAAEAVNTILSAKVVAAR